MKHLLVFLFLVLNLAAATAPDSIAGKIYRSHAVWKGVSPRFREQETIVFEDNRRFTFLKFAKGQDLIDWNRAKVDIQEAPLDGTYIYERVSDTGARVALVSSDGQIREYLLTFTSPNGGGRAEFTGAFSPAGGQVSFFLTDYASSSRTAPNNVSMRGTVGPGRPLIFGFIIPGPTIPPRSSAEYIPALGEVSKEVLVRVVGPSLAAFGVLDRWGDPNFAIYKDGVPAELDEKQSADWDASPSIGNGLKKIFSWLGAFPLSVQSKDAAGVFRLTPGAYTIVCTTMDGDSGGDVLVEAYFLP